MAASTTDIPLLTYPLYIAMASDLFTYCILVPVYVFPVVCYDAILSQNWVRAVTVVVEGRDRRGREQRGKQTGCTPSFMTQAAAL
jgi:hypothetical protein